MQNKKNIDEITGAEARKKIHIKKKDFPIFKILDLLNIYYLFTRCLQSH